MDDDNHDEKIELLVEARDSLSESIANLERAREHAPQPAAIVDGVYRFRENPIVRNLLDSHPTVGMNELAEWKYEQADYAQFLQLIGYSISGIPRGSDHQIDGAQQSAELLVENEELKTRVSVLEAAANKPLSLTHHDLEPGLMVLVVFEGSCPIGGDRPEDWCVGPDDRVVGWLPLPDQSGDGES